MHNLRGAVLSCLLLTCGWQLPGQADFRVYHEHPRLFLEPDRLDRLRRDIARQTLSWQTLRQLIDSGTVFPEQPLVDALIYQVEQIDSSCQTAVAANRQLALQGLKNASDLRETAIVYDWCYDILQPETREELKSAMVTAINTLLPQASLGVGLIRSAVLSSIALAGDWTDSEPTISQLLDNHWRQEVSQVLTQGGLMDDGAKLIAILETTLVVRHNLEIDLLQESADALMGLVRTRLLSYWPVDVEINGGRAHRPSSTGLSDQDARLQAPLYRIADMLLVAYESNLRSFQFLQGWIRNDNYMLRSPMGIPYEFLWVNPYLPGLAAQSSPLLAHDPVRGRIYFRIDWQNPTTWYLYHSGILEILSENELTVIQDFESLSPIYFSDSAVVPIKVPTKLQLVREPFREQAQQSKILYLIGLKGGASYVLKINNRDPKIIQAGAGGIYEIRSDPLGDKRTRIDFRKKVRLQLRPAILPTDPRRQKPSLSR